MQKEKTYEFEKKSLTVFILTMIANAMGMLFQVLAGHIIDDVSLFADLNVVMALLNILVLPTTVLSCFIVKYIALFQVQGQFGKIKDLLIRAMKISVVGAVLFVCSMLCFRKEIANLFNISDSYIILLTIVLAGISLPTATFIGGLQGLQAFTLYGLFLLIGPTSKVIGVVLSLFFERKIISILTVWIGGILLSYMIGSMFLKKLLGRYKKEQSIIWDRAKSKYLIQLVLTNTGILLLSNLDILIIKHNFNYEAGLYSAALMLGKIVTYFTGSFIAVIFPMAAGKKEIESKQLLKRSIIYSFALESFVVIFLNIFADFCIVLLLGNSFLECKKYLFPISAYVLPFSILNLIGNYAMAQNRTKPMIRLFFVGSIMEIIGAIVIKRSLMFLIWYISGIMWILVICSIYKYIFKQEKVQGENNENDRINSSML